jgi:hypothetical protein
MGPLGKGVPFGTTPWHMWGNTVPHRMAVNASTVETQVSNQLLRVDYRRPETWSFFLGCKITSASAQLTVPGSTLEVFFNLITGVGRTMFDTTQPVPLNLSAALPGHAFARFSWALPANVNLLGLPHKWTTTAEGPLIDELTASATPPRNVVEWFPAETIQMMSRARLISGEAIELSVDVTAYVAPRTHVRPDWLNADGTQFPGGETGGT